MKTRNRKTPGRQAGFNLMEILIAIVVFAIGMMALAQFQGGLTRSSADANARTVAYNLAEELIEDRRGFGALGSGDIAGVPAYEDITDNTFTLTRGGLSFTITEDVTDYYYDRATDSFVTTNALDKLYSDMKVLTVTVAWASDASPEFRIDDSQSIAVGDIGSGAITISTVIKSATTQSSGLLLTQEDNDQESPLSPYSPGERPDVIGLDLGGNRFKESMTPIPDVISRDELVETNFDVITYSQTGDDSLFLRLENFKSVTCACAIGDGEASSVGEARRPTLWAADQYEEGEWVTKTVGVSALNNQSPFCDICCRDHHDGGTGEKDDASDRGRSLYDPWRPGSDGEDGETDYWLDGSLAGDHKHWGRDNAGNLVLADGLGDPYQESCRMVRVDGYWRLTQDFRRAGKSVFPWDYFIYSSNAEIYSDYVTRAVHDLVHDIGTEQEYYFASSQRELPPPEQIVAAGAEFPTETLLPTWQAATAQQLRARGIYLDFMSAELREVLDCLDPDRQGRSAEECSNLDGNSIKLDVAGGGNFLEAVPFFDVQLTWLDRWTESPTNVPVEVSNEALADDNTHSRGLARLVSSPGSSLVYATSHQGNIGFTDTDPIDLRYDDNLTDATITVNTLGTTPPPPPGVVEYSGTITSGVSGVQASRVEISAVDASCDRTNTSFRCWTTGDNPTLTVSNYAKRNVATYACSPVMNEQQNNDNAADPRAIFDLLSGIPGEGNNIVIQAANCN